MHEDEPYKLVIFVSTAGNYKERRRALRNSWFQYLKSDQSPLNPAERSCCKVWFAGVKGDATLEEENAEHKDIVLLDAAEGYEHLWRKALVFLEWLEGSHNYTHVMHADDDSFLRLDLLIPLLKSSPRERFYWGYIWNIPGNPTTAPIRDPKNKSRMPVEQYPEDTYPPFASGCGFALSRDLVKCLLAQPLPDYRLLDPPFGIHLCGPPPSCVVPGGPVTPVHDSCVRPYRPLPTFRPDTLVQHYLKAEEMKPFYKQALAAAAQPGTSEGGAGPAGLSRTSPQEQPGASTTSTDAEIGAPAELYNMLVDMGIWRR